MKRLVLLALVACGLHVQGQDMSGIIKTNPLGWLAGQYQFGYEHFLSESASVQVLPGGIFGSVTLFPNDSTSNLTSVGAGRVGAIVVPEFRYYFSGEAPDGMYIAPFGRYRSVTTTLNNDGNSSQTRTAIGGGFVLGYQYSLANGLTGEVFLGPQFKSSTTTSTGAYDEYGFAFDDESNTGIRFGINIGFGFRPLPYGDLID